MSEENTIDLARCENCPYWVKQIDPNDVRNEQGECRVNPPQMIGTPMQTQQGVGLNIQSLFPRTGPKGWCAQHPQYQIELRISEAVEVSEALADMAREMMLQEGLMEVAPPDTKPPAKKAPDKKAPAKAGEKVPK